MNETSSDNARNLEARVTEDGEALDERAQAATAATATLAGQAQKIAQDAAAATAAVLPQRLRRPPVRRTKYCAIRAKRHSKLGRKRAGWRRTS
jgi:hypothetical protein